MPSRKRLCEIIERNDLSDVWRCLNGNVRQYTWAHAHENLLSLARLDRFYSFKHHHSIFKSCKIYPVGFSDHSLVICSVLFNAVSPRSAYWHFNTALMNDVYFKETFTFFGENFRNEKVYFSSLQSCWDFGKTQIKIFCQQYTQNITKETVKSIRVLETEILSFQERAQLSGNQAYIDSLFLKKTALSDLQEMKAQGALVRSRFKIVEQMDVPSKKNFSLEKKNGQKRFIHSLLSESGSLLSDSKEIRERAVSFYEKLYKSEFFFFENLPKMSNKANLTLSKPIGLEELFKALQGIDNGKVPGLDGIPVEFYKSFWSVMGEDLLVVLNDSLTKGLLPMSCRRAV